MVFQMETSAVVLTFCQKRKIRVRIKILGWDPAVFNEGFHTQGRYIGARCVYEEEENTYRAGSSPQGECHCVGRTRNKKK